MMMSDLNVVALVGRLTRDAVVRTSAKGDSFCQFTVAVNRSRKREDGTWEDAPHFLTFTLYGERAERLTPYLVKGQAVSIQGHLVLDKWESQGVPHSRLDVAVEDLRLIGAAPAGGKPKGDDTGRGSVQGGEDLAGGEEPESSELDPDLDLGETGLTGEGLL
jgi:single-strand DNA-binding protein